MINYIKIIIKYFLKNNIKNLFYDVINYKDDNRTLKYIFV